METDRTPLGAAVRGLLAGAIGTAIFTGYQALRSRRSGDDEGDGPPRSWDDAPTPAQVGQRVAGGLLDRPLPPRWAPQVNQVVHWAYGAVWGSVYGLARETFRAPLPVDGLALAGAVVAADYTALPLMKLYEPPWQYPVRTLASDFGNHAVYGFAVAGAYRALERI